MSEYAVGIDIGGQSTTIGIVDKRGVIKLLRVGEGFLAPGDYKVQEEYVDALSKALDEMFREVGGIELIEGVGIGAPSGSYLTEKIDNASNLPEEWKNFRIVDMVKKKTGIEHVFLDNDANVAALGEWMYGGAKDTDHFIMITLGTGVGSGIVAEGRLIRGKHGLGGELGHTRAVACENRKCGCGLTDCLERYTAATGVAATAIKFIEEKGNNSALKDLYDKRRVEIKAELQEKQMKLHKETDEKEIKELKKEISRLEDKYEKPIESKDVSQAAKDGDALANEIYEYTGAILGRSIANFIAFSDPDKVFLFGGLAKAGDLLLKPTRKAMEEVLLKNYKGGVEVYISELNDNADVAILGASALVWEGSRKMNY